MKLSNQILRLSSWSGLAGFINVALLALLYLYLTHHLTQIAFGIYALASSVIMIGVALIENSFSLNLIRKEKLDEQDYEAVLVLNFLTSCLSATFIISITFLIQKIYEIENAIAIVATLLPILFLVAFNAPHLAGLKRHLLFKKLAIFDLICLGISVITIIILVHFNYTYWALIFGLLVKYLVGTLLILFTRSTFCKSILKFNNPRIKEHFRFGKYILLEKSLTSVISYLDVYLIGYFLNIQNVGVYDLLKKIILRPFLLAYQYLEDVVFPFLSQVQHDVSEYARTYKAYLHLVGLIIIPALCIILINMPWLIALLPSDYSSFLSVAQLILIFGVSVIVLNPLDMLLYSVGKSKRFFIWYLCVSIVQIVISIVALQYSLEMYLMACSGLFMIAFILAYRVLLKSLNIIPARVYFSIFKYIVPVVLFFSLAQMAWFDQIWILIACTILLLLVISVTIKTNLIKPENDELVL